MGGAIFDHLECNGNCSRNSTVRASISRKMSKRDKESLFTVQFPRHRLNKIFALQSHSARTQLLSFLLTPSLKSDLSVRILIGFCVTSIVFHDFSVRPTSNKFVYFLLMSHFFSYNLQWRNITGGCNVGLYGITPIRLNYWTTSEKYSEYLPVRIKKNV